MSSIIVSSLLIGCNDFLNVGPNKSQIDSEKVFSTDVTATAAMTAVYSNMITSGNLSGGSSSLSALCGFYSGELFSYGQDPEQKVFELHSILSQNSTILTLWNFMYNQIYQVNAVIEGVQNSSSLSIGVAHQLEGEARVVRAFTYFYLVNLFGDVPLSSSTTYNNNRILRRSSIDDVYKFIESDLLKAKSLLPDDYVSANRARPNKATASALLARMYLYSQQYSKAEEQASTIIDRSEYQLSPKTGINSAFVMGSAETIWQLMQVFTDRSTQEGYYFIITSQPNTLNAYSTLMGTLLGHFETGDLRRTNWINSYTNNSGTYYYPFKYKQKTKTPEAPYVEASIVFRLAEIYLIRAEARIYQGKLVGGNSALSDLNIVRNRAGLMDLAISGKDELLLAVENERYSELFTEYGHRWLDLKRTGRAMEVLGMSPNDLLWPIPASEFTKNPNLGPQNPGY